MPTLIISGTSKIEDTFMRSDLGDVNYGANGSWIIGKSGGVRREIVRLARSAIPRGSITGFRLVFWRYSNVAESAVGVLQAFSVTNTGAWIAGTANGVSQAGSSCWNRIVFNTTAWPGSSGCGTAGTDYDTTAVATLPFAAYAAGADVQCAMTLPPSLAVSWRDGIRAANGVLIKEQNEAVDGSYFFGRSVDSGANPVTFEVDYNPYPYGRRLGARRTITA